MLLVRHIPYYYLRSFQKLARHGSFDEMLLTTNKRWKYFITLPPATREDALLVLSQWPMHRCCCHQCADVLLSRLQLLPLSLVVELTASPSSLVVELVSSPASSSTLSSVANVVIVAVFVLNVVVHRNRCHC